MLIGVILHDAKLWTVYAGIYWVDDQQCGAESNRPGQRFVHRLGHARAAITLDLYSHVTPGLQRTAALRFNEALRLSREQAFV